MLGSNHTYGPLVSPNPMAYVLNNQVNSVVNNMRNPSSKSNQETLHEQLSRVREQNGLLQRKLQNKTSETDKLQNKIDKIEAELHSYKMLVEQIKHSFGNGEISPGMFGAIQQAIEATKAQVKSGSSKKSKSSNGNHNGNCHCCIDTEKPYNCDWENCGKRFRQKQHLDAHRNVHTGRRFRCEWPDCSKSFCRKFNLVEHAKMHRTGNPNLCTFPGCSKVFSSKYGLVRHQTNQHSLGL